MSRCALAPSACSSAAGRRPADRRRRAPAARGARDRSPPRRRRPRRHPRTRTPGPSWPPGPRSPRTTGSPRSTPSTHGGPAGPLGRGHGRRRTAPGGWTSRRRARRHRRRLHRRDRGRRLPVRAARRPTNPVSADLRPGRRPRQAGAARSTTPRSSGCSGSGCRVFTDRQAALSVTAGPAAAGLDGHLLLGRLDLGLAGRAGRRRHLLLRRRRPADRGPGRLRHADHAGHAGRRRRPTVDLPGPVVGGEPMGMDSRRPPPPVDRRPPARSAVRVTRPSPGSHDPGVELADVRVDHVG